MQIPSFISRLLDVAAVKAPSDYFVTAVMILHGTRVLTFISVCLHVFASNVWLGSRQHGRHVLEKHKKVPSSVLQEHFQRRPGDGRGVWLLFQTGGY